MEVEIRTLDEDAPRLTWEKPVLEVLGCVDETQGGTTNPFEDQTGWAS